MSYRSLLVPGVQQFLLDHAHDDPHQLSLQAHRYPDYPIPAIAEQLQSRQKARHKLPDWYATAGVLFPPPLSLEQCSSQATAQYKQSLVQGQRLVDLTGGAGVDTYYLSHSFAQTDYVEQHATLAELAAHNFATLACPAIRVNHTAAEAFLKGVDSTVDCIYLDPARRDTQARRVFRLEDCQPNVLQIRDTLLNKARTVLLKAAPLLDIDATVLALQHVAQVHVVAVRNEVKEVLYLMDQSTGSPPEIKAVNLGSKTTGAFTFLRSQEREAMAPYGDPLRYLYEPNAALMKTGAFKLIAQRFGLLKLHSNTHLYTADEPIADFPGRCFQCRAVVAYQKKAVLPWLPEKRAHLAARNFPDSVAVVRKKLGLRDGGDDYLFAVRLAKQKAAIIITKKVKLP